MDNEVKEGL